MIFKRWRKKAEDRSVRTIILKKALVKLEGPYADDEEEERIILIYQLGQQELVPSLVYNKSTLSCFLP
jgi:hypothetical protein